MAGYVCGAVRRTRVVAGAALAIAVVIGAGNARASEPFPPILAAKLDMPCVPNCLPCHTAAVGTAANQRFDGVKGELETIAAQDVGSEQILRAALDALLAKEGSLYLDSDGDRKQDLVELRSGDNPYGGISLCEAPRYGCFASSVSPAAPTRFTALTLAWVVAGALWLRRRR